MIYHTLGINGLSISVKMAAPALPSCVKSNKHRMVFVHFHNFSTRNRDHLILLLNTGNAHK